MRHFAYTLLAALLLCLQAGAQDRPDRQELSVPGGSTMILLGDPQGYEKYDINQGIFEICTAWIRDNVEHLGIKAVLCTGDLVEQNDNNALDRRMLNQTSRQMWESVSRAFERLDGVVPYITSPGNHDYGFKASEDIHTYFPDYFPAERQGRALLDVLVSEHPNREGRASIENSATRYSLPGWKHKILVISSEFSPSDAVLGWAKKLCEKYSDDYVIFLTHSYMKCAGRCGNERYDRPEKYPLCQDPTNNYGQQIWDKLVDEVPNLRLVLCGHHGHSDFRKTHVDDYAANMGWRVDKNKAGKDVGQMMFNVQTLGGGWEGNGGDGWLRILEFLPDGKTLKVHTYSPLFGISPLTKHLSHLTDPLNEFEFVFE
ncbi:MAG: metallophosphoesterase [Bacteroidales bacterium]|nr:metallophosphoesterase [Bacteroidales bacterium]MBR0291053.1 metallophosphoesterase [Bacteroidales bacterium]